MSQIKSDQLTLYPCGCNADKINGHKCGYCGKDILGFDQIGVLTKEQYNYLMKRVGLEGLNDPKTRTQTEEA